MNVVCNLGYLAHRPAAACGCNADQSSGTTIPDVSTSGSTSTPDDSQSGASSSTNNCDCRPIRIICSSNPNFRPLGRPFSPFRVDIPCHHNNCPSNNTSGSTDPDGSSSSSGTTVPDGSSSGSSSDTDQSIPSYIQYVLDENGDVFLPYTVLEAVLRSSDGVKLSEIIDGIDSRVARLEVSSTAAGATIRVADNLETPSKTIALSAAQGKKLYDMLTGPVVKLNDDASYLVISDGAITDALIADQAVTTDKIADASVTEDKLADDSVSNEKIANEAVTKEKLSAEIVQAIENIESIAEWQSSVEERLDALEEQMQQHETNDALILEQNQFLLREHQKMKHLVISLETYDEEDDIWVSGDISITHLRMDKMKFRYQWHYYDEIDMKDYRPVAFECKAVITSADSSVREVVLSTDNGLNNIEITNLGLNNLAAGDVVKVVTTVNYCWLDWVDTQTINITD